MPGARRAHLALRTLLLVATLWASVGIRLRHASPVLQRPAPSACEAYPRRRSLGAVSVWWSMTAGPRGNAGPDSAAEGALEGQFSSHCRRLTGGGGFAQTPPFTMQQFRDSGTQGLDCPGMLNFLGPDFHCEWLLLTDKRSKMREIFELETKTLLPCAEEIEWGLWRVPGATPLSPALLSRQASARGLLSTIAGPCTSAAHLVDRLRALDLRLPAELRWTMHHEKLSSFSGARDVSARPQGRENGGENGAAVKTAEICACIARSISGGLVSMGSAVDVRFVLVESRLATACVFVCVRACLCMGCSPPPFPLPVSLTRAAATRTPVR